MSNETNATNSSEPAPVDDTKAGHEGAHGGHPKLGEFASTAICGNDITSSCLYVSALAIGAAGKLAPFALLIVAGLLFLFRSIYTEVVGALPLNGGAYNALLNTTSKSRASVAACLTILSYMATAVISAGEAMHYAQRFSRLQRVLGDDCVAWDFRRADDHGYFRVGERRHRHFCDSSDHADRSVDRGAGLYLPF
jgi:hypothetical protein